MALSISSSAISKLCSKLQNSSALQHNSLNCQIHRPSVVKCEAKDSEEETGSPAKRVKLQIGSPIIVTEAPKMIKTASSVPCLRVNSGLVKPGDVGRIVSRKPKDVWAVRLSIGTYLIDGKYFKPLDLADYN
ncbi:hypothetical protein L6164_031431 [Bauhinia variegata]|uniref:Uncharacterized protein n=1 Tax=Bauhinia variegata TaxID=167791 RepID=A0ACB9LFU1_BAUVA|nr:hypothetical protein L6164_031431 [Bauhinia variegata]